MGFNEEWEEDVETEHPKGFEAKVKEAIVHLFGGLTQAETDAKVKEALDLATIRLSVIPQEEVDKYVIGGLPKTLYPGDVLQIDSPDGRPYLGRVSMLIGEIGILTMKEPD